MHALTKRFISNLLVMRRFLFCLFTLHFSAVWAVDKPPAAHVDDDVILIEEEDQKQEHKPENITSKGESFLETLKDTVFFRSEAFLQGSYQLTNPQERPIRGLGSLWATLGFDISDKLSLQLSGIARLPIAFSWSANSSQFSNTDAFLGFYDSFLKIRSPSASLSLGYLLIPWVNTRGAGVLNRLNPIDYRPGQDFTATVLGKIPQVGAYHQTSVFGASVDSVILLHFSPSMGSLVASEQNGVQIGHYQGALVQNQIQIDGILPVDRQDLLLKQPFLQTPVLAIRVKKALGDTIDLGLFALAGFNEVPSLRLSADVSQFLGSRYFDSTIPYSPGAVQSLRQNLRASGVIFHERQLGLGLDLSLNLGAVVLKGELLVEPKFQDWGGKTTILVSRTNMRSLLLPAVTFALAADAEYGDWFSGSFELVDTVWLGVPKNEYVLGVEPLRADVSSDRTVHRLAFAGATESAFWSQKIWVRLRGEVGLLTPDILARMDASYHWDALGLYVGAYSNLFFGVKGSPGWLRQDATSFGVYVGHKI